jgi:hypothetical protein
MEMESNLYRVSYVYRSKPPDFKVSTGNAAVQEKIAYVVAKTDTEAIAHIHGLHAGNEVVGASIAQAKVFIAGQPVYGPPDERRHNAKDTRPVPTAERRHGAPDTRQGPLITAVKATPPKPAPVAQKPLPAQVPPKQVVQPQPAPFVRPGVK